MKKSLTTGFDNLLNPTPTQEPARETRTEKVKGNYKTVCYSIAPDIADKIKYIAHYDRKKMNEVVTEAFVAYIEQWEPTKEKPKKL